MGVIKLDDFLVEKLRQQQEADTKKAPKTKSGIDFDLTKDDRIRTGSVKNMTLILQNDKNLKGLFRLNEFTGNIDVVKDSKLPTSLAPLKIEKGRLIDQIINSIQLYIEDNYDGTTFKDRIIDTGVANIADINSYNPVRDYMEEAHKNWDKKRRLDDFFPTYLGVEKSDAQILITRLFFLSVVAKVYAPETKIDFVLDLVGSQGVGKTTLLQKIAPLEMYTDQFLSFSEKDDYEIMRQAVIVNDDEMAVSNKSSFEEIKRFITMRIFDYRYAYKKHPRAHLKKCILVRTTNDSRYLRDKSGDRRFLPLLANKDKQTKHPVTDLDEDYVKQLWGEAVWLYKISQDHFKLTKKQEKILEANRMGFKYMSGLEEKLLEVLENDFPDRDFISNSELSFKVFNDSSALSRNTKEAKNVRYYMRYYGYETGRPKRINDKVIRGFTKMNE